MTNDLKAAAALGVDGVGRATVVATKAMDTAVQATCAALAGVVQTESDIGQFGATRREAMRIYQTLGRILTARYDQVHDRVATLRLARTLGIFADGEIGDYCTCLGPKDEPATAQLGTAG